MRCIVALFALLAGTATTAEDPLPLEIPSPVAKPAALVAAYRANDLCTVASTLTGRSRDDIAREWEQRRERLASRDEGFVSEPDELDEAWAKLSAPATTAALADELARDLPDRALGMLAQLHADREGAAQALADLSGLPRSEAHQFEPIVGAIEAWALRTSWSDRARVERALDLAATYVRRSGIATPEEVTLLPVDEACAISAGVLRTAKDVLRVYDVDADAILASIRFEELWRRGDRASVRANAIVFGTPVAVTVELRYADPCEWLCSGAKAGWIHVEHAAALDPRRWGDANTP